MPRELTVHAEHEGGMRFSAAARGRTITIDYPLQEGDDGDGVEQAAAERALKIAEEQIFPVWAMLEPGTPITASLRVGRD